MAAFAHLTLTYAACAFPVILVLVAVSWRSLQLLDGKP